MKDKKAGKHQGRLVLGAIIASMVAGPSASILADTLVLRDGRQLTGEVERVDGGYRVRTATGYVQVARSDVAEWKRSGDAAAPATPAVPNAAAPRPATAPTNAADRKARTIEVLVGYGNDAMALGDYKAARDLLVDAIQVDPRNRQALTSLGYCYIRLDDVNRAMRSLEAAVVGNPAPSREVTINLAYSLLRTRNPMRGAKLIKDYLAANPTTLDEEALNAFAICLGQSSEEARLNRFWTECVAFYEQYNARVEATRPGQKRWGVEWLSQSEWSVHDNKNKSIQSQLDRKSGGLEAAKKEFYQAKKAYEDAYSGSRFKKSAAPNTGALEARVRSAKEKADTLQREYNEIAAKFVRPTLPNLFEPMPMDFGSTALASATGTGTGISSGSGTPAVASPGLRADPEPVSPPVTNQPKPAPVSPDPVESPVAVNPPAAPPSAEPKSEPRKRSVFTSACGFAVGPDLILTTADSVEGASRISVQPVDSDPIDAELVRVDAASGLALIRLKGRKMAYLPVADSFGGGVLQCVSYPTVSIFDPACEVIGGSAVPPKDDWTIRLNKHPRVAGGPILAGGKVVGVCLASRDNDSTTLPSASLGEVKAFIGALPPSPTIADPTMAVVMVSGVKEK